MFMTVVLIILIVIVVIAIENTKPFTNKSINHVVIFYFIIYVNSRQLNLFGVAQYLLFEVARYKCIPTNSRLIYFFGVAKATPCI